MTRRLIVEKPDPEPPLPCRGPVTSATARRLRIAPLGRVGHRLRETWTGGR